MKINIDPADCYGCEYLDGDDWRCTAGARPVPFRASVCRTV